MIYGKEKQTDNSAKMTTQRGELWLSRWDAEHQRLGINHQKVDVGITASTFNYGVPESRKTFGVCWCLLRRGNNPQFYWGDKTL